jgi:hypothetical protein
MFKFQSIVILSLTFLCGCVLSFYPLFENEEIRYNPALVGVWNTVPQHTPDSPHTEAKFTISQAPVMGNTYIVQMEPKDGKPTDALSNRFVAQIGFIGTNRFLQILPQRPDCIHAKSLFGGHFIPAWSFWKLELNGDRMSLYDMNEPWLEDMLKAKKLEIKHEQQKGGFIVLTASAKELKAFIAKHDTEQGFYMEKMIFSRQK